MRRSILAIPILAALLCSGLPQIDSARADDPFEEILGSKNLKPSGAGVKRARRSKLHYAMGPWFEKGSNFERLFRNADMAQELIEWIAPIGKQFVTSEPDTDHEETHIKAEAVVQERATRAAFGIAVLVPHPAFITMVEGKLVEDFALRLPPLLKAASSEKLKIQGFDATAYTLENDRCTLVVNAAQHTLVEIRSVEPCPNLTTITELAKSLNLIKLNQKLQS